MEIRSRNILKNLCVVYVACFSELIIIQAVTSESNKTERIADNASANGLIFDVFTPAVSLKEDNNSLLLNNTENDDSENSHNNSSDSSLRNYNMFSNSKQISKYNLNSTLDPAQILSSNDNFFAEISLNTTDASDSNFTFDPSFGYGGNSSDNWTTEDLTQGNESSVLRNNSKRKDSSDSTSDESETIHTFPETFMEKLVKDSKEKASNEKLSPDTTPVLVDPDVKERIPLDTFSTEKSRENTRRGRQASFNKAGRRARLPGESRNELKPENEKSSTASRSAVVPSIPPETRPTTTSTFRFNDTEEEELNKTIAIMRASRAGSPVLFGDDLNSKKCTPASGGTGTCRPLVECRAVRSTISSQTPTICGWKNDMPIVCCPAPELSQRVTELSGCGKRPIPGLGGSRRVRRQAARIAPLDFANPNSGPRNQKPTIAGGENSVLGAWPWMAGLYTMNFGIENFLCGAAVISQYFVVTAAHCFGVSGRSSARISPSRYSIRVGSIRVKEGDQHFIEEIIIHPEYIPREYYNDLALIRLKTPIRFGANIQPICLPSTSEIRRKKLKGRDVTVAGWGDQEFGGKRATILQEVTVQVIDPPTCDKAYLQQRGTSIPRGITNQFLCAGVPEGGKDACQRDSGGPLMLLENDVWVLVGVVSFGFQCAQPGFPGVYTRVTNYLDWLQEKTAIS